MTTIEEDKNNSIVKPLEVEVVKEKPVVLKNNWNDKAALIIQRYFRKCNNLGNPNYNVDKVGNTEVKLISCNKETGGVR